MVTVQVRVESNIARAWAAFTDPDAVTQWNFASDDWCCLRAESDLKPGGTFNYRMEARDGSAGFDFAGTFKEVRPQQRLRYTLGDGREVVVDFLVAGTTTRVVESFTPENTFPVEQQQDGWQAILDNYKRFVERGTSR
jgi:uncharacterized protein YndB with AHSA1/START domain